MANNVAADDTVGQGINSHVNHEIVLETVYQLLGWFHLHIVAYHTNKIIVCCKTLL